MTAPRPLPLRRRDVLLAGGATPLVASAPGRARPADNPDRERLYRLLGDLPDRRRPIASTRRGEVVRDGYVLETWELDLNGLERVPAFLARPRAPTGRAPAILFNHSHGGNYAIGKQELVDGRKYLQPTPYAKELTDRGYVVLAIDHWTFGARAQATEDETAMTMLSDGRVLWGMRVFDSLRAVDFLAGRPDVDPARIGTLGISMGSTMAWWLAAMDERIKVTVDLCCLTDLHTLQARRLLWKHGLYYIVPGVLKHFTTARINALIAPRAHLSIIGTRDLLTPPDGLDIVDAELRRIYAGLGHAERWKLLRYDVGHQETADGRREVLGFLGKYL